MEQLYERLRQLFHSKVLAYQDLIEVLKTEKRILIDSEVDKLWKISDRKQSISTKIEAVQAQILSTLGELGHEIHSHLSSSELNQIFDQFPLEISAGLKKVHMTMGLLKDQVQQLVKYNKLFVEKYLNVLDEMIGIITTASTSESMYGQNQYAQNKNRANLILHKEV